MSLPSLPHSPDSYASFDGQVRAYRRAFQRELRRRPTNLQRVLMETAAVSAARFDYAAPNPDYGAQNLAHLMRVARRAAEAMRASFPARSVRPNPRPPTLADTLTGARS